MNVFNTISRKLQSVDFPPPFSYATFSHSSAAHEHDGWHASDSAGVQAIIDKACVLALQNGVHFIWIDSLCIDQDSSADVSEAINSSWKYFQSAALCMVYLFDLPCGPSHLSEETWKQSQYWSRVWSLQVLVFAPRIVFYDSRWHLKGDTSSDAFSSLLSRVTGIDADVLAKRSTLHSISIARRMSWAVGKRSFRAEDLSYALLGIFGIRLSIIYGEGEDAAFRRLQEEILKTTSDTTLFAWTSLDETLPRGIFARSVEEFKCFGQTELASAPFRLDGFAELTSRGVLIQSKCLQTNGDIFLDLGMPRKENSHAKRCGISIRRRPCGTYFRVSSSMTQMVLTNESAEVMRVIVEAGDINTVKTFNDQVHATFQWSLTSRQKRPDSNNNNNTIETSNLCHTPSNGSCFANNESSTSCHSLQPHPIIESPLPEGNDADWVHVGEPWANSGRLGPSQQGADQTSVEESDSDTFMSFIHEETPAELLVSDGEISEASNEPVSGTEFGSVRMTMATSTDRIATRNAARIGDVTLVRRLARQAVQNFRNTQQIHLQRTGRQKPLVDMKRETIRFRRHRIHATKRKPDLAGSTDFACPFLVKNPWKHLDCLREDALSTMLDVRDHLWRSHRVPYHCPVCIQTFVSAARRDEHILERDCRLKDYPNFQGVTQDQRDLISRTQDIPGSKKQWFAIWDILFPGEDRRPKSAFVKNTVGSEVGDFRTFFKARGLALIGSSVEELWGELDHEGGNCATALHSMVLGEAINALVDGMLGSVPSMDSCVDH
ncbi:hypothetical protein BDP81DRAFT_433892 [Colletotrichum phormii]|uniref:Vegetative incompatibility protein HET-E-1 n=1 Tax=Colletotrichum phormii TaxID=359342 RepID=A0AAJ0EE03_9PEZI|nr:uncharacterized protein BDP81DRAFT_433892 [Colletotrichum phormii]KAK1633505.1 hypothetical protein BDP81DRAFT_433892 [Colletotrichum phormii]